MKKPIKYIAIVFGIFLASSANAAVELQTDADKNLVLDYLQNVMAAKNPKIVDQYMAENIIQHGPRAADGLKGMKKYLKSQPGGKTPMKIEPFRILKEDDLIIVETNLFNANRDQHYMHMFRVENNKIIEYWEGEASIRPDKPNQFKGPNKISDLDKTQQNKLLAIDFINDVYVEENAEKAIDYVAANFLQHDTRKNSGAQGVVDYINKQKKRKMGFRYVTMHHVIAEGNFVMILGEAKLAKAKFSVFDIYRIEDGKIAEHWNVTEKTPHKMRHKNTSF
ncbi:MAG: nuclear transport factor 2 family protein [Hyphomicrobiales bacterium]